MTQTEERIHRLQYILADSNEHLFYTQEELRDLAVELRNLERELQDG